MQGQVISNDILIENNSEKMIIAMQQNTSNWMYSVPVEHYPTKFTITQSLNVTNGYTTWGGFSFERRLVGALVPRAGPVVAELPTRRKRFDRIDQK